MTDRCPSTFVFPGFTDDTLGPSGEVISTKCLQPPSEVRCELIEGHAGPHWGGPSKLQPWGPGWPNEEIGIRPRGAFCVSHGPAGIECDLRYLHQGKHANRKGMVWT